jgi:alpha-L-rhamnosidase
MQPAGIHPVALRTEYRTNPLGIDTPAPRLSWEIRPHSAARGLRQAAYHVLVATDPARLAPGVADRWDSSTVESAESAHIAYAGQRLGPREICHWTVRIRDQAGNWSEWSEPARWAMGAVDATFWSAQWIGTGETLPLPGDGEPQENTLADAWLRRSVTLDAPPRRATVFVASVGFHELYVNGVKASDAVLVPNVTDNSKRARYVAYEIGHLLQAGRNALGLWLGTGWSIFPKFATADKPRAPIVLAQCDIDLPDGGTRRIVTDAAWRTHPSPSRLIGGWDFRNFGGELYDAGGELPAWAEADFDDAAWKPAAVFHPKIAVSADCAEPNVLSAELRAVAVEQSDGTARIDLGRNYAGWIELPLGGEPGQPIELQFSERSDRAMTHRLHSALIPGPDGRGVFRNRFNYGVGRWVTVTGLKNRLRPEEVRGWLVRPAYARVAEFECSNPLLNEIFATTRWTFENLTLGGYVVDCPHRERLGYGGDAHATTTTGLSLFALGAFYKKWSEDWRDVQGRAPSWGIGIPPGEAGGGGHEEGNMPYTAPTYWGGGGPAWSGYCVHLPWEVYRRYGDEQILRDNLPTIERWLAFLETKAAGDLLGRYGGSWDFLGDWLWPGAHGTSTDGEAAERLFFNNCYWIYNLRLAAAIARIVGREDLRAAWSRRAVGLRRAVHARFYNAADASYVNGFQAYLAMALLVDVPPQKLQPAVWKRLEHEILVVRSGHIHAGITGGTFLFQLLMEARRDDLILKMVNRDDPPGWGAMLRRGATTFWETWDDSADSHLHSSFLYVGAWFVHGVLGIQPDPEVPGFKRFIIRPGVTDDSVLTWARGHYDSIRGRIAVSWRREGGAFLLDVQVPPNTEAQLELPTTRLDGITESGRGLPRVAGVMSARMGGGRALLHLASGEYRFACR